MIAMPVAVARLDVAVDGVPAGVADRVRRTSRRAARGCASSARLGGRIQSIASAACIQKPSGSAFQPA